MRIKIVARSKSTVFIPFSYQYQLHSAMYKLISQSSSDYASYLHDTGFVDEDKRLKLFTFSKLLFANAKLVTKGFQNVTSFAIFFSTPVEQSMEHLVLGIFTNQVLELNFGNKNIEFLIEHVESLPEPSYYSIMKFSCLAPIAVTGKSEDFSSKHYLNYTNPTEREQFISQIELNLLRKYRLIHKKEYSGEKDFDLQFDFSYIIKKKGKISKNIRFKNSNIIGMEAPFTIKASPELIKIGYDCGFGIENSAGFGMVEVVK